jgi:hypothetical protein
MNRLEIDRSEVWDLSIEGRQTALILEPSTVVSESDVWPLTEEGPGELEGQGDPTEKSADALGLVTFRVGRVVPDGMTRRVAEK